MIVSEVAALAVVEMMPPDSRTCPTSSGQVYVSFGTTTFEDKMRLLAATDPDGVIRFTEMDTFAAAVFVTVNLSMMHLQFDA